MNPSTCILDEEGRILYQGSLYRIALREGAVDAVARGIYGEGEICLLRREIARKRIYFQLKDIFATLQDCTHPLLLSALPTEVVQPLALT